VAAALRSAAEAHDGALCLVDAASVALATTYGDVVADPRDQPAVMHDEGSGRVVAVRVDAATLADAGSLELLGRALRGAPAGAALTVLAGAISAAGRPVRELSSGDFPVHTVAGPGDLGFALDQDDAADEAALRLRRASRADDGFLSTFLVRPVSRRLTRRAVALGLRPNTITGVSFVLGLLAAGAYAGGAVGWLVLGSVLLLLSLVVDCVDGEVARYTRTFSPLGGWLDVGSDRVKEYAVYAGLAYGAAPPAWGLAAAAFAVLVVRHFVDFGYAATVSGGGAPSGRVADWSERTSARPALMWAKRAIIMPVGERTIALAVLVPIIGARAALWVLLVAGCIAAAYTTAGRLGRLLLGRGGRSLRWLAPAARRLVAPAGVILLVALHRPDALPGAYLLLAVVAMHDYDLVFRRRLASAPGAAQVRLAVWAVGVLLVVLLTLVLPAGPLGWVFAVVGAAVGVVVVADSVRWWGSMAR
jgi:phosphatidylglycerophosphate synthase